MEMISQTEIEIYARQLNDLYSDLTYDWLADHLDRADYRAVRRRAREIGLLYVEAMAAETQALEKLRVIGNAQRRRLR
jgi:hypothetical protein